MSRGLFLPGRCVVVTALLAALFLCSYQVTTVHAAAQDYVVTATDDTPDNTDANCLVSSCTLRQALNASNANQPGFGNHNSIEFAPSANGSITLSDDDTHGALAVTQSVTITGNGAAATIIQRDTTTNNTQVFNAQNGSDLNINGLTVRGGYEGIATSGFTPVNLSVLDSVIAMNVYGIFLGGGTLSVSRSLFLNNSFANSYFALSGGSHTNDTISNSTFVGGGYGVLNNDTGRTVTIASSTFSNQVNDAVINGIIGSQSSITVEGILVDGTGCAAIGTIVDGGHNIEYPNHYCNFSMPSQDPRLSPLGGHGGPTQTFALLPGSPAIDAGGVTCPATDQRGFVRPQGVACDIGAYEYVSPPPPLPAPKPTSAPQGSAPIPVSPRPAGPALGVPNPLPPSRP